MLPYFLLPRAFHTLLCIFQCYKYGYELHRTAF
nr:MAG TPA: hypothetical protein [Caudoviricetes sp.]